MERSILVAIDGSTYSRHALTYLATLFAGQPEIRIHLLSLVPAGPAPAGSEWLTEQELMNSMSPTARKQFNIQQHCVTNGTELFLRHGFAAGQINETVRLCRGNIAREILHEARQGRHDALVIGRRGIGKLEEMILGSISATLLEKCHDIPLWIIDGEVDSRRFLVPVDGTFHSLMAIDHLAFILKDNPQAEITLFHSAAMLANRPEIRPEEFYNQWGREWCDAHLTRPDSLFHAPRQLLIESGFPAERILWLQTMKGIDPSRQILRQALIDDFGTIVMGRRGSEAHKGLFRGVSDRVLLMAEKVAIWIVG
ncbi:MAG: universal stress protein [Thermodesulfobacteriota bacterium]